MKDCSKRQSYLAELKLQFNSPLRISHLIKSYDDFWYSAKDKELEEILRSFLFHILDTFIKYMCIDDLTKETVDLVDSVKGLRKEKYIEFNIFESGDYKEANKLMQDIYTKWNDLQLNKEYCSDHIILIRKAITYVSSMKKIISAFITDEKTHKVKYKTASEGKKNIEFFTVSLDSYIDVLKDQITELSAQTDLISSKINMLMRAESSLRLLSKYAEWENVYNNGSGKSPSGKEEGDGFSVEES